MKEYNHREDIDYLKMALLDAKSGEETRMLLNLEKYYNSKKISPSKLMEKRLYEILCKALEHNIRRSIFLGLGTDKSPICHLPDLIAARSDITRLLEIKEDNIFNR